MKNNLKILHVSSPGYKTAGRLVFDIHAELISRKYKSFIISKADTQGLELTFSYYSKFLYFLLKNRNKLIRLYRKIFPLKYSGKEGFSFLDIKEDRNQFRYRNITEKIPFKPDVVLIYALQEFINIKTINKIHKETGAKIYWLLYDIAPLTGGCHYSWNCRNYMKKCGNCPQLMSSKSNDITRKNWNFKFKHIKDTDVCIIPCSEWLNKKALESSLFKGKSISKWMVPMDISFKYQDKITVKNQLGLRINRKYIMFGAVRATDRRKGLNYLIEAFKIIKSNDMVLEDFDILVLGKKENFNSSKIPFNTHSIGFVSERDILIKYYQAAHIVIVPSIEDAGPLMISEAISCGTPVVAFEMGSAFDLVHSGTTGYRAELKNSNDLAKGISSILNLTENDYSKMSESCIKISEEKLSMSKQIDKLIEIFEINS